MKIPTPTRMMALILAGTALAGPLLSGGALAAARKPAPAPATAPTSDDALTREAARVHAIELFDKLDFNHDGTFNAEDREARRAARLGARFDQLDTNHDGAITKAEFIAAHTRPEGPRGDTPPPPPGAPQGPRRMESEGPHGAMISPMVFEILRDADPQHTGSVTKDAFIAAELKRFDAADTNHDGKVTQEELRASRPNRHHGWGSGGEGFHHDGPDGDRHGPGPQGRDTPPPPPAQ